MTYFASATMKKQIEQKLLKFDDSVLKSLKHLFVLKGTVITLTANVVKASHKQCVLPVVN